MSFQFEPNAVYTSPIYFGPQRYHIDYEKMKYRLHQPADTECLTVMFESNPAQLEALLPEPFQLTDPVVTVMAAEFANIGWLAGNTYRILQYSIPCALTAKPTTAMATFCWRCLKTTATPL